ncbi:lysylphosphatidylglycerol synthase transmembrane domain-containing protein [Candidatus Uabimicrobium sp. HlEnr_7]|uniref:lysylphosphatidylglycerol synthase transmembrane domain-containing protein n=1 Tax=Candidatus Uabimicrobium helgolandensis TaxID=3095367 RepID=UPI003557372C
MIDKEMTENTLTQKKHKRMIPTLILMLGLSFITWFFYQLEWDKVLLFLAKIDLGEISILVAINLLLFFLFCLRWWIIFVRIDSNISFSNLVKNRLIGFAISYITPGPLVGGEPLQIFLLKKINNIPATHSVSALFIDRYVDFLANFTFVIFATCFLFWNDISTLLSLVLITVFSIYVSVIFFYIKKVAVFSYILEKIPYLQKIYRFLYEVELQVIEFFHSSTSAWWQIFALCITIWGITIFELWFTLYALDLEPSLIDVLTVLLTLRLVLLTPFPGGIGILETSQMWVVNYLGFNRNISAITTLLIRGRDASFTLCGLYHWQKYSQQFKNQKK